MGVVGPVEHPAAADSLSSCSLCFFPFSSPMCSPRVVNRAILLCECDVEMEGRKEKGGGPGSFLSPIPAKLLLIELFHSPVIRSRLKAVATVKKLTARAKTSILASYMCFLCVCLIVCQPRRNSGRKSSEPVAGERKFDTGNGFIIREGGNPFFFIISLSFFSFLILSHSFDFRSFSFRALTGLNPDISN